MPLRSASGPVSPVRMRIASSIGRHENLAVADASGVGGLLDRLDRALEQRIVEHDFDLHLGQEVDDVFGAAIELGVALLAAEALGFGHGHARMPISCKRLLHLVELERLDDRFDLFHRPIAAERVGLTSRLDATHVHAKELAMPGMGTPKKKGPEGPS